MLALNALNKDPARDWKSLEYISSLFCEAFLLLSWTELFFGPVHGQRTRVNLQCFLFHSKFHFEFVRAGIDYKVDDDV